MRKLVVKLSACGNPDFGQGRYLPGVRARKVVVSTLDEASAVCRAYIEEHDLGGGNWNGGEVLENGVQVARVSYNGRVWAPDGSEIKLRQNG